MNSEHAFDIFWSLCIYDVVCIVYVCISTPDVVRHLFSKKVNPKTKYGYVMTVFAPFLNPNFHLPLFYRLLLPWTAWIASGFKYLLG